MGLGLALKAHQAEDFENARIQYTRAYQQDLKDPLLYQNFGALLKKEGFLEKAFEVYSVGLKYFPDHLGILQNFANFLSSSNPSRSLELSFHALKRCISDQQISFEQKANFYSIVIQSLINVECYGWALEIVRYALHDVGIKPEFLKHVLLISDQFAQLNLSSQISVDFHRLMLKKIADAGGIDSVGLLFALADHYRCRLDYKYSSYYYELAINRAKSLKKLSFFDQEKLQEMIDINSWNTGCSFIQSNDFVRGWPLFEYGLRTPAKGHQKWQRALIKPFTVDQIAIWRGESGHNKRLLLLEEQAVGDVIMFSSLLSTLLAEFAHVGLLVSPRLLSIYLRSFSEQIDLGKFSVYTHKDLVDKTLRPTSFDYQAAIGSICCHRFTQIESYAPLSPFLRSDSVLSARLRSEYLNHGRSVDRLVGVSWRGGSQGIRMKQKSIADDLFGNFLLQFPNVRFVDLQYGDTSQCIAKWRDMGISIVSDQRINALKNMDAWLTQVSTCDQIVSIANTTIHGAGALNIPTMCLLSKHYDWRWLHDTSMETSYWYPSVSIARESKNNGWSPALSKVSEWIINSQVS